MDNIGWLVAEFINTNLYLPEISHARQWNWISGRIASESSYSLQLYIVSISSDVLEGTRFVVTNHI